MRDWTLHLVTARGQLAPHEDSIRRAVAAAEARMRDVAPPLALDLVVNAER